MAYFLSHRLTTAVTVILCLALSGNSLMAGQNDCSEDPSSGSGSNDSGLRAYIDPQTGELTDAPPSGTDQQPEAPAATEQELEQEVLPDGTVLLRLSERERPQLQAEIVEGKVTTCHQAPGQDGQNDDH